MRRRERGRNGGGEMRKRNRKGEAWMERERERLSEGEMRNRER